MIPIVAVPINAANPACAVPPAPTLQPVPLALYIHWPWCVRKCPYCDFNSHEISPPRSRRFAAPSPQGAKQHLGRPGVLLSAPQEALYLDALIADLEAALPTIWGRPIVSVFIGGGTPSLMSGATVDALLTALRMRLPLLPGAEITLEANPGTVEAERFKAYRDAGVNRLSLGIQSFEDGKLAALGRIHSGAEAHRAIEIAQAHFERINLDLMVALPEQALAEARRDIEAALATGVSHLSAYHLTLEPNTAFAHAPPPLPDDDLAADMLEMVAETLVAVGFEHYETSAFARAGQRCAHNLNYWQFGDYLGIGAGAHSKISPPPFAPLTGDSNMLASLDFRGASVANTVGIAPSGACRAGLGRPCANATVFREARPRHPKDYLADPVTRHWQPVAQQDLPGEFMMNALRLTDGVPISFFSERTGLPLSVIEKSALAGRRAGLLEVTDARLRPTALGRRFLNRLIGLFLGA